MEAASHDRLADVSGIAPSEFESRRTMCADLACERALGAIVVTDPGDLRYFIGHAGYTDLGANPFSGPVGAALVVAADGTGVFVVGQPEGSLIELDADRVETRAYPTFTDLTSLRPRIRLATGVAAALDELAVAEIATIGFAGSSLPASVLEVLRGVRARATFVDIDDAIGLLRMRKSPAEIALIRRSVELCDAAQLAITRLATAGMTQADVLDLARTTIEDACGVHVPMVLEAAYGSEAEGDGAHRELRNGDLLLTDVAPQIDGYWGDSCDTRFIGDPDPPERTMIRVIEEALTLGTETARPGITADALDGIMRGHVGSRYPPYAGTGGHGVGLDYHESPRLIPGEEIVLEPGMVLAMEPGVYLDAATARLEHVVHIVSGGCEVLSRHLEWHELY